MRGVTCEKCLNVCEVLSKVIEILPYEVFYRSLVVDVEAK